MNVDSDAIMFGFYSLYFICWGSTAVVVLVFLEDAEIEKVLVSKKISKPKKKKILYWLDHKYNKEKPLHLMLPETSAYAKRYCTN